MPRSSHSSIAREIGCALALLAAAGCGHKLQNGRYTIAADGAPSLDSCGLAPDDGGPWSGSLSTTGDEVFFTVSVPVAGQGAQLVELVGFFKSAQSGSSDGFVVD